MKWLADENFRNAIIRGLLRRRPRLDIVRAQDMPGVAGQDDLTLLQAATDESRIVLTHDLSTMVPAMTEHSQRHLKCAFIVFVPDSMPVADVIEQILLLEECAVESDWTAGVLYLPLR